MLGEVSVFSKNALTGYLLLLKKIILALYNKKVALIFVFLKVASLLEVNKLVVIFFFFFTKALESFFFALKGFYFTTLQIHITPHHKMGLVDC